MPYVLNVKIGTTINHPAIGALVGGVARHVTRQQANQVKNWHNVVIFNSVLMPKPVEVPEQVDTIPLKDAAPVEIKKPDPKFTWQEFLRACRSHGITKSTEASVHWKRYKETGDLPWQTRQ